MRSRALLAFLLAAYAGIAAWQAAGAQACVDYYQFWVVGRAARAGEMRSLYTDAERRSVGEIAFQRAVAEARTLGRGPSAPTRHLQAAAQRRVLETYSTPWLYTLVGLASLENFERSQDLFQRVSLLAFVLALAILVRLLRGTPTQLALWCAVLLPWFGPVFDDALVGNVNRIQLFLLALFLGVESMRFRGHRLVAGAILGSTLAFKPNLAVATFVVLLGWAVARDGRRILAVAAGIAVGGAASVLASAAWLGSFAPWPDWLAEIPKLAAPGAAIAGSAEDFNFSFARLLGDATGVRAGPWLLALLLAAVAVVLVVERRRTGGASDRGAPDAEGPGGLPTVRLAGIGCAVSLLASEPCWLHYYVAVVPVAMVLLRTAEGERGVRSPIRALAVAGLFLVSLQNVGRLFDLHDATAAAVILSGGTGMLLACALADLGLAHPAPDRAPDLPVGAEGS